MSTFSGHQKMFKNIMVNFKNTSLVFDILYGGNRKGRSQLIFLIYIYIYIYIHMIYDIRYICVYGVLSLSSSIFVYGVLSLSMEFYLCIWSSIFAWGTVLGLPGDLGLPGRRSVACLGTVLCLPGGRSFACLRSR